MGAGSLAGGMPGRLLVALTSFLGRQFPLLTALLLAVGAAEAGETAAERDARMEWWREGRFGLFIHWGPVSLTGKEISWSRANSNPKCPNKGPTPVTVYDNLYKEFNPTKFDATQWVALAKAAGVKYIVLTAKHCDGFLLWRSQASDYNIGQSPFQRDICAELAKAARAQGIRIGWYFSPMDWRDPDFRTGRNEAFLGRMQAELRELLGKYGPIDLLWFDWDGHEPLYDQARTYGIVKALQPNIVVNNRLDLGKGDSDREILSPNADYYTPEQTVGAYDDQRPWESCMTVSHSSQWAWGGPQDGVKPFRACLEMLIRCAGGDGNLLFNIGPTPTGEIAPEQAERLRQMSAWLAQHGESIYGTRGGPFKPGSYGVSTRKGRRLFLHILDWLEEPLRLPPVPAKLVASRVLGGGAADARQTAAGLEIFVAEKDRQPVDTVVALEFDTDIMGVPVIAVPGPVSLAAKAKAAASNVYRNQAEYGADKAVDGQSETRWACDAGVRQAWLEVDLGRPVMFSRARISEAFPNRVQKFELQRLDEGAWKTFHRGTTIGESWTGRFAPVTAQRVRLNILEATDGPTLWEFQLFKDGGRSQAPSNSAP